MKRERHRVCSHSTPGWGRADFFQVTKLGQIEGTDGEKKPGTILERLFSKKGVHKKDGESGHRKGQVLSCEWGCSVFPCGLI